MTLTELAHTKMTTRRTRLHSTRPSSRDESNNVWTNEESRQS